MALTAQHAGACMREVEPFPGPGHADVEEPALFIHITTAAEREGENLLLATDDEDDREFQPLGGVQSENLDAIAAGIQEQRLFIRLRLRRRGSGSRAGQISPVFFVLIGDSPEGETAFGQGLLKGGGEQAAAQQDSKVAETVGLAALA